MAAVKRVDSQNQWGTAPGKVQGEQQGAHDGLQGDLRQCIHRIDVIEMGECEG